MPQQDGVVISELVKEGVKDAGRGDAGHSLLSKASMILWMTWSG